MIYNQAFNILYGLLIFSSSRLTLAFLKWIHLWEVGFFFSLYAGFLL